MRVERSSCAPLGKLRRASRGVEGVERMLVGIYTAGCGCVGASRGVAGGAGVGLSVLLKRGRLSVAMTKAAYDCEIRRGKSASKQGYKPVC